MTLDQFGNAAGFEGGISAGQTGLVSRIGRSSGAKVGEAALFHDGR